MRPARHILVSGYWAATLLLLLGAIAMAVLYAPTEATMGPVQKLFYLHLPAAVTTFLACFVVFVGSAGYLLQRRERWDDLAQAAAQVAVVYCSIVLVTGMVWAHSAWGRWWTWSPRLTFSLVLWLLYAVYLAVRPSMESPARRALVCAVYGVVAFLDAPLVYMSTQLLPDIHPRQVELDPAMRTTLLVWFVPVTMAAAGWIWVRYARSARARSGAASSGPDPSSPSAGAPARRPRVTGALAGLDQGDFPVDRPRGREQP